MFIFNKKAHKGFTLIELLIVVAIIAILAAIAVPNFLEAQVRAKVSRMHADMRTLATAIESYAVDKNSYPSSAHRSNANISWVGESDSPAGYQLLTTPVAYLAAISLDVFSVGTGVTGWGTGTAAGPCPPQYFSGTDDQGGLNLNAWVVRPRRFWLLVSPGPDLFMSTDNSSGTLSYQLSAENSWGNEEVFLVGSGTDQWSGVPYDATNGTLSNGDLYRFSSDAVPESFK